MFNYYILVYVHTEKEMFRICNYDRIEKWLV